MSLRSEMLYHLNVLYKYSQLQIHLSSEVTRSSMRSPQKYTTVMWQERTPNSQKPEQIQEPYRGVSSVCFKWNTFQMGKRHQLSLPAPLWCQNIFQLPETDISTLIPYFMQHFACWGEKLSQTQFSDTLNWYMSLQCNTLQLQERLSSTVHLYPHLNSYPSCSLMWLELSTLPLSVSVRNGKNGLCLYSTFLAYWPLETLYNTCHTHTHTHMFVHCWQRLPLQGADLRICNNHSYAHSHTRSNWVQELRFRFCPWNLGLQGPGIDPPISVDDCPASWASAAPIEPLPQIFCLHTWLGNAAAQPGFKRPHDNIDTGQA